MTREPLRKREKLNVIPNLTTRHRGADRDQLELMIRFLLNSPALMIMVQNIVLLAITLKPIAPST